MEKCGNFIKMKGCSLDKHNTNLIKKNVSIGKSMPNWMPNWMPKFKILKRKTQMKEKMY